MSSELDKEAQEVIAVQLAAANKAIFKSINEHRQVFYWELARETLLELAKLGYRKRPEGEPPLLTSMYLFGQVREVMEQATKWHQRAGYIASEDANKVIDIVEKAQRKADKKFYTGDSQ